MKINKEILFYIMLILFFLMAILMFLGLKDAEKCLGNPFKYGANKITSQDTGDINCVCSFESAEYAPFYFNKEEIGVLGDVSLID